MGEIKDLQLKVWSTLGMLALTVAFCYLPWIVQRKWRKAKWLISILNCLAGGVVLGALIMHMIPEMVIPHDGPDGKCTGEYQWGCLAAGVSFLLLFSVDRLFLSHAHCENETENGHSHGSHSHDHKHDHALDIPHVHHPHSHASSHSHSHGNPRVLARQESSVESFHPHDDCHEADIMGGCHMEGISTSKSKLQTYVFVFCLSLHSLLEGLGMSGKTSQSLFKFLFGLFAHKWIEAFALGVTVMGARFTHLESFFLMTFYAVLTPIGIALGMLADLHTEKIKNEKSVLEVIMNGASAGSFLFVSCIEMIPPEFHTKTQSTPAKFMAVIVGFIIMAGVATYHSH
jgi:zinc transporter 1/2/3